MLGIRNWKTSAAGVASILAVVAKVLGGGDLGLDDLALITGAIGLLTAKDKDVSHSPNPMPEPARAPSK